MLDSPWHEPVVVVDDGVGDRDSERAGQRRAKAAEGGRHGLVT